MLHQFLNERANANTIFASKKKQFFYSKQESYWCKWFYLAGFSIENLGDKSLKSTSPEIWFFDNDQPFMQITYVTQWEKMQLKIAFILNNIVHKTDLSYGTKYFEVSKINISLILLSFKTIYLSF